MPVRQSFSAENAGSNGGGIRVKWALTGASSARAAFLTVDRAPLLFRRSAPAFVASTDGLSTDIADGKAAWRGLAGFPTIHPLTRLTRRCQFLHAAVEKE